MKTLRWKLVTERCSDSGAGRALVLALLLTLALGSGSGFALTLTLGPGSGFAVTLTLVLASLWLWLWALVRLLQKKPECTRAMLRAIWRCWAVIGVLSFGVIHVCACAFNIRFRQVLEEFLLFEVLCFTLCLQYIWVQTDTGWVVLVEVLCDFVWNREVLNSLLCFVPSICGFKQMLDELSLLRSCAFDREVLDTFSRRLKENLN